MKNNNWKKKIQVAILVFSMLLTIMPVSVLADQKTQEAETTVVFPEDAIYLSTAEDILAFAENCRVNIWSIGKTVVLSNDIDMTDIAFAGIPTFGGHFYGQGFTIKGIAINADGSQKGFFRYLQEQAIVENLNIIGSIEPGGSKSMVGGLAGHNAGIIRKCTFNGTVCGYEQIGGIAGVNESSGVIEECTVSGMVYGSHFVGGLVGENSGVVRNCVNEAEINTRSVQNAVDIGDITIDNLINTENAATTTDIGGIAGINSGVLRACENKSAVGYQSMGYNIGGIAGSQNGFIVECKNYANIQGRKEVGGIVGHMEPDITLTFTEDSLQKLEKQMGSLDKALVKLEKQMQDTTSEIQDKISDIETNLDAIKKNAEILSKPVDTETGTVDIDKLTVAAKELTSAVKKLQSNVKALEECLDEAGTSTSKELDKVMAELDKVMEIVDHLEDNIQLNMEDISGDDTDKDTTGKVSQCINYGNITGDMNIGGIAGIMAEENDLDDYEDTSIYGDYSMNVTGQVRVVVRDCINYGTVKAGKNYAGGIVGDMAMGAVLESVNLGHLDCISADYVGGIAGNSKVIIRNSTSKCIIAGADYVGGIAGMGNEVKDCYTFIAISACGENAGAVLGNAEELPSEENKNISGNYYFIDGKDMGGIDGISYTGATEKLDLAGFLKLPNLNEELKTVTISFITAENETTAFSISVGENLAMDKIPTVEVEEGEEYEWILIPVVTSKVLGMGETAEVTYLSEETLSNILFSQTYEISYGLKDTVIQGTERDENNRPLILAEGSFAKNTTIALKAESVDGLLANGEVVLEKWQVVLSHTGVTKLHYLIPKDVDAEKIKLYVQDASERWSEREFSIEGSYIVFSFADGEYGFELVETAGGNMKNVMIIGAAGLLLLLLLTLFVRKSRKKQEIRKAV